MTVCAYCGEDVGGMPCKSTRDMEERIDGAVSPKECFAALMILGGGERSENQRKAAHYLRLAQRQMS